MIVQKALWENLYFTAGLGATSWCRLVLLYNPHFMKSCDAVPFTSSKPDSHSLCDWHLRMNDDDVLFSQTCRLYFRPSQSYWYLTGVLWCSSSNHLWKFKPHPLPVPAMYTFSFPHWSPFTFFLSSSFCFDYCWAVVDMTAHTLIVPGLASCQDALTAK